ncbi:Amino-acid permease inda1 [Exophiala dermatitidis]|uniref:AAT family amino acid transporter n=2 Tax=Exophiala dermatitidis TaxID=5970 RepID=H6BS85_EXODN|nr:AAT family amino acid transporter [Exophiala dermatitidis NIH/UT8656]KAJ4515525.1 Amino-acid permease inda1 [Exophiala dermatitidis]EHY54140.1 AAT family amino acid transporter [Exophiala dermatitidis NIH/UT8656]KAJ4519187.1 Amino-acid permease inda1 [Exophiala dermatitidis]KAJ4529003.1 Amino-acid permease inda1 [Exophiala dermatitidis]KAJ4538399.1 Amino-acid permease inda1 [Exophiala dermatitidis]
MAANKPVFSEAGIDPEKSTPAGVPLESTNDADSYFQGDVMQQYYNLGFWTRMGCTPESFKRRNATDKNNQLNQTLRSRHMHMIAIGGSIGAGLFVGTGSALRRGGPASLLIDYAIIGVMIFNVVFALGELGIMYPISGGFYTYSTRFIDPSWGFAMGWNYCFQWAVVLPLEITVASFTIFFWTSDVHVAVWISMFLAIIIVINVFGVLGYGEEEFWASALKLSAIVIFMIIALVCVCGGGPSNGLYHEYWGARLWHDPGAFRNGFKGFCSVFVTAAFAFSGTELVGLAAAESRTPLKSLPSAVKQVFWRITLFYILSLLFVGLLVRSDDDRLLGANPYIDAQASPFVLAARDAGLKGFDSFMNVVILVSVISIGNSGVYGGSRTLTALAEQGYAPKIFAYVDRAGRPTVSTVTIIAFGALAYLGVAKSGIEIFDWLQALSGLAALFTWGSICLAHIRFRAAWKHQGRTLDEIPFKAVGGVYGSWLGLILIVLVMIAQFYVAIWPPGGGVNSADGFFKSYLALPVVMFFWLCGYLWKRQGWLRLDQIDLDAGRRHIDWEAHHAEQERRRNASWPMRIVYFMF